MFFFSEKYLILVVSVSGQAPDRWFSPRKQPLEEGDTLSSAMAGARSAHLAQLRKQAEFGAVGGGGREADDFFSVVWLLMCIYIYISIFFVYALYEGNCSNLKSEREVVTGW